MMDRPHFRLKTGPFLHGLHELITVLFFCSESTKESINSCTLFSVSLVLFSFAIASGVLDIYCEISGSTLLISLLLLRHFPDERYVISGEQWE